MINILFQNMIEEMYNLHKMIGIIDNSSLVIACNNQDEIGKTKDVKFTSIASNDFLVKDGFTYRYFGDQSSDEFAVFMAGEDSDTASYTSMISVPMTQVVKDYTTRHSKSLFMKNLLFDNLLPGEALFRIRELKIKDNVARVCLLIHPVSSTNILSVDLPNLLRSLFPNENKDIIVELNGRDIVIIKEFFEKREERKEHNLLLEVKQVIILCPNPCVKSLIIDFHEHTRLIRKTYLLRNQDRGSDDSSDNYCYNKVTLLTA